MANAETIWRKLTWSELLQSDGHKDKLADLVQKRYVISRHEADRQVRHFMNEYEA